GHCLVQVLGAGKSAPPLHKHWQAGMSAGAQSGDEPTIEAARSPTGASYIDAVACAMGALVDLRDLGTGHHSTEIVELAIAVGAHYGWETRQLRELEIGATL